MRRGFILCVALAVLLALPVWLAADTRPEPGPSMSLVERIAVVCEVARSSAASIEQAVKAMECVDDMAKAARILHGGT